MELCPRTPHRRVILDMDSSESPVHGEQEGASYNGPLWEHVLSPFVSCFNQFGDCEGAKLRAGNVHSAHRWRDVLDPIPVPAMGATGVSTVLSRGTPHSPSRTSMSIWRSGESSTQYGCRATRVQQYEIAPTADTTCGEAAEASSDPIRRLLVSCRELGPRSACGGQGGVA